MSIQFITDTDGKKQAVIVSMKDWNALQKLYKQTVNKLKLLTEIGTSMKEVQSIESGKKAGKTLDDLLREL